MNLTSIGLVSRDNNRRILHTLGKKLGDIPLVVEAIAIRESLRTAVVQNVDNIVVEVILRLPLTRLSVRLMSRSLIFNHVVDIKNLARNFNNVQFNYCTRAQNTLADSITKDQITLAVLFFSDVCSLEKEVISTFIEEI